MIIARRLMAAVVCLACVLLIPGGCGGLPPEQKSTGAIVVFAAFEGPQQDAQTIRATALVVIGGVRGLFVGPSEQELILRNIPFGDEDPPRQPMTVTAPGYRTVSQQLNLRRDMATFVDLTMEAVDLAETGTVKGVVRSSQGDPIVNALVAFRPDGSDLADAVTGFTDANGRYSIGGIPIGPGSAEAVAAGFLPDTVDVNIQPDNGGTNADVDFSLVSGQTAIAVRGVVRDLRLETPLAGASVTLVGSPPVVTGVDGRFEIPGILVGAHTIRVTLEGYDDFEDALNVLPGMGDVVVLLSRASGDPPTVPHTIGGSVTLLGNPDNAGALVTAFSLDRGIEMARYVTQANGRYYLFVPAGRYEITASFGGSTVSRTVTYGGGGRIIDNINFTLSAGVVTGQD